MLGWAEYFCGTETHVYTLAEELKKLGHEVDVFTYLRATMWEAFRSLDVGLLEDEIEDKYDLAIINNNGCLVKAPKSAFKIFISNGVIPEAEYPVEGADEYVAVSEEVQKMLAVNGYESTIIRNSINIERFQSTKPTNKKLKNVLYLSNKITPGTEDYATLVGVCNELNLNLSILSLGCGTSQWDVENWINESDLVVTMGRGAYEAMACERSVLVAGYGALSGIINDKNFKEYRKVNTSTRTAKENINVVGLVREFKKYDQKQGIKNREMILENNDVSKVINQYLNLYYNQK